MTTVDPSLPGADRGTATSALADVAAALRALTASEAALLRAELASARRRVVSGLIFGAVALLAAAAGVVALIVTLVFALQALDLPPWAAAGIVALALIATALIAAVVARRNLSAHALLPHRTLASLRALPATLSSLVTRNA